MTPELVYIDDKWVGKAPKVNQYDITKRRNRYRDRSLKGFVVHVLEDGSVKAFINSRFKGEKSPRNRELGFIGKAKDNNPEHWRLLIREIKDKWRKGEEHDFFKGTIKEEEQSFAARTKELLEDAPELKKQNIKLTLTEKKLLTVYTPKSSGKVRSAKIKPIYADGKGNGVRSKTLKNYFTYWNNHVATSKVKVKVGNKLVALVRAKPRSINADTIEDWAAAMRKLHTEISDKGQRPTADKVLQFLRACFERWGKSGKKLNPVIKALSSDTGLFTRSEGSKWNKEKPKEEDVALQHKEAVKIRKEIQRRLEKLSKSNTQLNRREAKEIRTLVMFLVVYFTGGRFDWILNLSWDQLNNKDWNLVFTKGNWKHKVMLKEITDLIKSYIPEDNEYVFWSDQSLSGHITDYDKQWLQVLSGAKIPFRKPKALRKHYNQFMNGLGYTETTRKMAMTQSPHGVNEEYYSKNFKQQYSIEREVYKKLAA
jgi:integrase